MLIVIDLALERWRNEPSGNRTRERLVEFVDAYGRVYGIDDPEQRQRLQKQASDRAGLTA